MSFPAIPASAYPRNGHDRSSSLRMPEVRVSTEDPYFSFGPSDVPASTQSLFMGSKNLRSRIVHGGEDVGVKNRCAVALPDFDVKVSTKLRNDDKEIGSCRKARDLSSSRVGNSSDAFT